MKIGKPYPGQPDVSLWVAVKYYCWYVRFTLVDRPRIWWAHNRPIVGRCRGCRWWALDEFDRGFRQCNYPAQSLVDFRDCLMVRPGSMFLNPESDSRLVTHGCFGCTRFDPRVGLRQNSEQADAGQKAMAEFKNALLCAVFPKEDKRPVAEGGG